MISFQELVDLVIMSVAIGYIFMDFLPKPQRDRFAQFEQQGFDWGGFWYATAAVAPSIILHEMAHKFTALYYGFEATFHAAYEWLAIGVGLKLLQTGFIFFVPGFVTISPAGSGLVYALIAFAGPLMHLLIWQGSQWWIRNAPELSEGQAQFFGISKDINRLLFFFNMLPIPGFDGFKVFSSLLGM